MSQPIDAAVVPVFDGHNDLLARLARRLSSGNPVAAFLDGQPDGHIDLPRARAGGFAGGLFAMWAPSQGDRPDLPVSPPLDRRDALDAVVTMTALLARVERASAGGVAICRSAADIRAAIAGGRLACVLHIEGAEAIDADFLALDALHAAGLRSIGPLWSRDNAFGTGVRFRFNASPDTGPGLTDLGKALVRACDERRILVDCSHLTEAGFWDVAATSGNPLVASHSNVHAISPHARNLTDRQLDAIRERRGLVGVNFATMFLDPEGRTDPALGLDTLLRHVEYLAERLGIDGVALGSDYDGATVPTVVGDVSRVQAIPRALRARGWSEAEIAKLCHGNWLRVLETIWGV
jgi:membrane dipeptidase